MAELPPKTTWLSERNRCGRFRLLATDIDGTLAVNGTVSSQTLPAIPTCLAAGLQVCPATGKQYTNVRRLCRDIPLGGPVVTCNGAVTVDATSEETIAVHYCPSDAWESLASWLASVSHVSLAVFTPTDIVCVERGAASRLLDAVGEPTTLFVDSPAAIDYQHVVKVLASSEIAHWQQSFLAECRQAWSDTFEVTRSSDAFIEFMPLGVTKGTAVGEIAKSLGAVREEIVCLGDNDNDLSMFDVSGLRIAVANASPRVLAAADIIVPSAADGGAAEAIRRILELSL